MGLFRRKLKPKPDPLIRWYGKLPAYGDYYDSGSGEEWIAEFTQKWLMNGYQAYESRRRSAPSAPPAANHEPRSAQRMPSCACLLQLPQSGMTVLSSCLDFGGDTVGRKFPLCFFAGIPTADLPGITGGNALAILSTLNQLLGLGRRVARFLNDPGVKGPEQFRAEFADQEVSLDALVAPPTDSWIERAKAIRMADWYAVADDTLGAADLDAWLRRARRWGEMLAQGDAPGFKAVLSFPLAPERAPGAPRIDRDIQVAGWVRWLEGRMDLKARPVSLVITDEPAPACSRLTVILGELSPDDFLLLTPLVADLEHVDNLAAVREDAPPEAQAAASEAPPTLTATTWADFVTAGTRLELKV
jgi:hypothetical protein